MARNNLANPARYSNQPQSSKNAFPMDPLLSSGGFDFGALVKPDVKGDRETHHDLFSGNFPLNQQPNPFFDKNNMNPEFFFGSNPSFNQSLDPNLIYKMASHSLQTNGNMQNQEHSSGYLQNQGSMFPAPFPNPGFYDDFMKQQNPQDLRYLNQFALSDPNLRGQNLMPDSSVGILDNQILFSGLNQDFSQAQGSQFPFQNPYFLNNFYGDNLNIQSMFRQNMPSLGFEEILEIQMPGKILNPPVVNSENVRERQALNPQNLSNSTNNTSSVRSLPPTMNPNNPPQNSLYPFAPQSGFQDFCMDGFSQQHYLWLQQQHQQFANNSRQSEPKNQIAMMMNGTSQEHNMLQSQPNGQKQKLSSNSNFKTSQKKLLANETSKPIPNKTGNKGNKNVQIDPLSLGSTQKSNNQKEGKEIVVQQTSKQKVQQETYSFPSKIQNHTQDPELVMGIAESYQQNLGKSSLVLDPGMLMKEIMIENWRPLGIPDDLLPFDFHKLKEKNRYERQLKIERYKAKKRNWTKSIAYECRRKVANTRLRIKGRFISKKESEKICEFVGEPDEAFNEKKNLKLEYITNKLSVGEQSEDLQIGLAAKPNVSKRFLLSKIEENLNDKKVPVNFKNLSNFKAVSEQVRGLLGASKKIFKLNRDSRERSRNRSLDMGTQQIRSSSFDKSLGQLQIEEHGRSGFNYVNAQIQSIGEMALEQLAPFMTGSNSGDFENIVEEGKFGNLPRETMGFHMNGSVNSTFLGNVGNSNFGVNMKLQSLDESMIQTPINIESVSTL